MSTSNSFNKTDDITPKHLRAQNWQTRISASIYFFSSFEEDIGQLLVDAYLAESHRQVLDALSRTVLTKWLTKLNQSLAVTCPCPLSPEAAINMAIRSLWSVPAYEKQIGSQVASEDWRLNLAAVIYYRRHAMPTAASQIISCAERLQHMFTKDCDMVEMELERVGFRSLEDALQWVGESCPLISQPEVLGKYTGPEWQPSTLPTEF